MANLGFHLLEPVAQSKRYAITNVDSLGVIERFTFAEVVREAAQWAALLRAKGLQPGDRVLVLAGREWGWRCALLGAIRAGGVAVPCPASLPLREIRAVASDAGASLLVSLRTRPDLVELDGRPALSADDLDAIDASEALGQPPHPTEARDIALILYSWRGLDLTGTMHTHASLLAQAEAADDWLGVADEERIWSTADQGSAPSIWLLLAALRRAANIVIVDLELEPEGTLELLDRLRPAAVWFSDEEYAALGSAEVPPWVDLGSIRRALLSDAAFEGATAFASAFGTTVTPVFGVDELGVVAGWSAGREPAAAPGRARPVAGVHVAVHGDDQEELPPGEVGDVVVRGDAPVLFTGYTGREHGRSRSATWFRLGWHGSLTGDGTLQLVDRSPSEVEPAGPMVEMPSPEVAEEAHPEPEPVEDHDEAEARERAEREAAEAEARRRAEEEREAEERRRHEEAEARERAEREAAEAAEARLAEEEREAEERRRQEEEARRQAEEEAKQRAAAEAEARRIEEESRQRAEDEKRQQEERRRAEEEAKQLAEDEKRREKEREREAKEREKREAEERRRAEEQAKVQAKLAEAEAKQRAKDEERLEKEREKREAEERRRAAEEAKLQAKRDEADARQREKDEKRLEKERAREEKEREKREAEEAKIQQKIAAAEAKQRAEDEKRREREREREEKEAGRRAEKEAKKAALAARKERRPEPKPAASDEGRGRLGRRRRQEIVEEPEAEHVEIDVVARIRQYGMTAASEEPPAEPRKQQEDAQQEREHQPSTD